MSWRDKMKGTEVIIETFEDWPKPGVTFLDMGSIFENPDSWGALLSQLNVTAERLQPDFLVGLDARGLPLVGAMAAAMQVGFAMCRKKGKLPGRTLSFTYETEYSMEELHLQQVRIRGSRVLIVDDVVATGGSIEATATMLRAMGKEPIGALTVFDLLAFKDRRPLSVTLTSLYQR